MKSRFPLACAGALILGMTLHARADDATPKTPPVASEPPSAAKTPPVYYTTPRPLRKHHAVAPPPKPQGKTIAEKQLEFLAEHKNDEEKYEAPDITHEPVEIRACTDGDIISGVWKMIYNRVTPQRREDRFNSRMKYQYLAFNGTHNYTRLKTAVEINDPKKVVGFLNSRGDAQYSQKYTLIEKDDKTEMVFVEGKIPISRQSCAIVVKPLNRFKPNDLILTGYSPDGKSLSYELYRRWF